VRRAPHAVSSSETSVNIYRQHGAIFQKTAIFILCIIVPKLRTRGYFPSHPAHASTVCCEIQYLHTYTPIADMDFSFAHNCSVLQRDTTHFKLLRTQGHMFSYGDTGLRHSFKSHNWCKYKVRGHSWYQRGDTEIWTYFDNLVFQKTIGWPELEWAPTWYALTWLTTQVWTPVVHKPELSVGRATGRAIDPCWGILVKLFNGNQRKMWFEIRTRDDKNIQFLILQLNCPKMLSLVSLRIYEVVKKRTLFWKELVKWTAQRISMKLIYVV
jgi:hypothetical protein